MINMNASLKKNIVIGIASVAGLLFLAGLGRALYFKSQFILYQDTQYKFSIKYPNSWKIVINPQPNVAVAFLRPPDTALDDMQENFNVTIQPVPGDLLDVSAFSAKIKAQMMAVFGENIKIIEDRPFYWNWREGREVIFESTKHPLIMVSAWVLREDRAYILTFLGEKDKYGQDYFWVRKMIRSLYFQ